MSGYLVNFGVYTMAMLGLIFFAIMVYKKFSGFGNTKASNTRFLSIEETISIAPRKNLYVVRAGVERFLIAGDIDKTTLISKLDLKQPSSKELIQTSYTGDSITENSYSQNAGAGNVFPIDNQQLSAAQYETDRKKAIIKTSNPGVDDLPEIVDFKNHGGRSNVLHSMLKKMNEQRV